MSKPPNALECAASATEAEVRPRYIRRTVLQRSKTSARFDAACEASGLTNEQIAAPWGVTESVVRRVRSGDLPLGDRLENAPIRVRRAYAQSLLDDADEAAPTSLRAPTDHHLSIAAKGGELAEIIRVAVADGVIDETEARGILRVASELEARVHALVLDQRRGCGR